MIELVVTISETTKIAAIIIAHIRTGKLRLEELKCHDNTISTTNIYYNARGCVWATQRHTRDAPSIAKIIIIVEMVITVTVKIMIIMIITVTKIKMMLIIMVGNFDQRDSINNKNHNK